MAGIRWRDVNNFGQIYSLDHLHPVKHDVVIKGVVVSLDITFGFHVFTDEKESGCRIQHQREVRYFCPERHSGSLSLKERILNAVSGGEYVTVFTAVLSYIERTEELVSGLNYTPLSQRIHVVVVRVMNTVMLEVHHTLLIVVSVRSIR